MTVRRHHCSITNLTEEEATFWRTVPSAVASDAMGRSGAMVGAIKPLHPSMKLLSQARTADCMVGDNSALHALINRSGAYEALVVNGQGSEDIALFGGVLCRAAMARGLDGLVIDGAVRDSAEIIDLGFPCFARAVVPRGPHKGFGGVIDGPIACGGLSVEPGDIVIGDADGVSVVPYHRREDIRAEVEKIQRREKRALELIAEGRSPSELYGDPEVKVI